MEQKDTNALVVGKGYLRKLLDDYKAADAKGLKRLLDTEFNLKLSLEEPSSPVADGFDSPVGTDEERASDKIWPGTWFDANGFGNWYTIGGVKNIHTGADLNNNVPHWDADRLAPVYAAASGVVTFSGIGSGTWGNMIIIRHDPLPDDTVVWSRYAHVQSPKVAAGDRVKRGQQIATIGNSEGRFPYHLHFDMAKTPILEKNPSDWPGLSSGRLFENYIDPKEFIKAHRPAR
ncbi:MAG TPA: M23 family metallopeptidase [Bellilinea sp.]|nr:M23 family metallopeptidase [Bellilinea sp.]